MKRIILTLAFASFIITSFAQKTALELLKSKISHTVKREIVKYSYFGNSTINYKLVDVVIIDVSGSENKLVVDGEFTYNYNYLRDSKYDRRTVKYQAVVKKILDDFSVIKVFYQDPKNKEWYRLFPANKFDNK